MDVATKNHLALTMSNIRRAFIPSSSSVKEGSLLCHEYHEGNYEKSDSGNNQVVLQFCKLLGNQALTVMLIEVDS